jgi:hypothetical protein
MKNKMTTRQGGQGVMKSEAEIKIQLRYWEGKLEGLEAGIKAVGDLEKTKEKPPAEAAVRLSVEKATTTGWVDGLRWVLKPGEETAKE